MNIKAYSPVMLCIHPVIAGKGLPLFKDITHNKQLTHIKTKSFDSGAIVLYYCLSNTIPSRFL